jgi:hypothetical protein
MPTWICKFSCWLCISVFCCWKACLNIMIQCFRINVLLLYGVFFHLAEFLGLDRHFELHLQ